MDRIVICFSRGTNGSGAHLPVLSQVEPPASLDVADDLVRGVDPSEPRSRVFVRVHVRVIGPDELSKGELHLRLRRVRRDTQYRVRVAEHGAARPLPVPAAAPPPTLARRRADASPRPRGDGDPPRHRGHWEVTMAGAR